MSVAWVSYIDPSGKRERYKAEFEGRGEMDLSMARHHRRGDSDVRIVPVRRSRTGHRAHPRHLYKGQGTEAREVLEFEERYGKRKGAYVYGAVVGKVKRERAAKRARGA